MVVMGAGLGDSLSMLASIFATRSRRSWLSAESGKWQLPSSWLSSEASSNAESPSRPSFETKVSVSSGRFAASCSGISLVTWCLSDETTSGSPGLPVTVNFSGDFFSVGRAFCHALRNSDSSLGSDVL